MPTAKIEFGDGNKSVQRVFDLWHWQQSLWVRHEAGCIRVSYAHSSYQASLLPYLVILSSMERGSRMNVGRVTLLRSAPGLS